MSKPPKIQTKKRKKDKKDEDKDAKANDYQLICALDLVKALYLYAQNDNANIKTDEKDTAKAEVK